jgi:predicted amidohydrolase YtcJ
MKQSALSALWTLLLVGGCARASLAPADLVITNARIYTANSGRAMAEAMAVRAGRIVYVGAAHGASAYVGPHTQVKRLGGRLVLPGLIDSHIHADEVVRLDVCDLKNGAKSLAEITAFVQACITHYKVAAGEWVVVRHWNYSYGNQPDEAHPTLRAALDLASTTSPVHLDGDDGHHSAFNSLALASARNESGVTVGYTRATLRGDLQKYRRLVGVDVAGEPNGTVNDDGRNPLDMPSTFSVDLAELMKNPARVPELLNSAGITGILDPRVAPEAITLYDTLERNRQLTFRAHMALYFDPDLIRTPAGQPDWDRMLGEANALRAKYAHDPLIRADAVKLFADGVMEGNPYAVPPTLPQVAALHPYLQPIFKEDSDGHLAVTGYVDSASAPCADVRAHPEQYDSAAAAAAFLGEHGHHPEQCAIASGQLQYDRELLMEFVRRFHRAGFAIHIHTIGDVAVRTALDAIEAARASDGIATQHDAFAHVQLASPDDVRRLGRDHLYVAFTYAWAVTDPEYDLSIVPFIDRVMGNDHAALHPRDGYYENNAYPVRSAKAAGATLVAGSDAPVDTDDPRPFVNMAIAVTRRVPGQPPLNPAQSISIRDVLDAYTINGAHYLDLDRDTGSLETGKSADFVVVDQDILALADQGKADDIARTHVLETWFMGRKVFERAAPR